MPAAVTAAPAPGPCTTSGCGAYLHRVRVRVKRRGRGRVGVGVGVGVIFGWRLALRRVPLGGEGADVVGVLRAREGVRLGVLAQLDGDRTWSGLGFRLGLGLG